MSDSAAAVVCNDLTVRRGAREALRGFSFDIQPGGWLAIVGRNGSGKSTLLLTIAGLLTPASGSVRVAGSIETVLQATALDRLLTIRENAMLFARVRGVGKTEAAGRIDGLAAQLGIADRLDDRVGSLSGGLARRADLLRACVTRPEVLLLDEPTAGLDEPSGREFQSAVRSLRESGSVTIVWVTHADDEARAADAVAVLEEGRLLTFGAPAEIARRSEDRIVLTVAGEPDRTGPAELLRDEALAAIGAGRAVEMRPVSVLEAALDSELRVG